eukprot:TRINITY_DN6836_c0_g1_i2.p1 TRINITY_DN6836_c0_g1~~TRINITY_DN6836_c0_g1_i2.p1  ORF type:complete len:877 (+),score=175.36 TRINITY_DN6836_c0_g1_i2:271-2901(+)
MARAGWGKSAGGEGEEEVPKLSALNACAAPWTPGGGGTDGGAPAGGTSRPPDPTALPWRPPSERVQDAAPGWARASGGPGGSGAPDPFAHAWDVPHGPAADADTWASRVRWGPPSAADLGHGHGIGGRRIREKPPREAPPPPPPQHAPQQPSKAAAEGSSPKGAGDGLTSAAGLDADHPQRSGSPAGRPAAAAGDDDDVIQDPFADSAHFDWGLQALAGMAPLFPPEDDDSGGGSSPMQRREAGTSGGGSSSAGASPAAAPAVPQRRLDADQRPAVAWRPRQAPGAGGRGVMDNGLPSQGRGGRGGRGAALFRQGGAGRGGGSHPEDARQATFARARLIKESRALGLDADTVRDCLQWVDATGRKVDSVDTFIEALLLYQDHRDEGGEEDLRGDHNAADDAGEPESPPVARTATWSPTLSMTLLQRVGSTRVPDGSPRGAMSTALEHLRSDIGRLGPRMCAFSEETLLRLARTNGPPRGVPEEVLVPELQLPELLRHYPAVMASLASARSGDNGRFQALGARLPSGLRRGSGEGYGDLPADHPDALRRGRQQGREAEAVAKALAKDQAERRRDAADRVDAHDRTVYMVGIDSAMPEETVLTRLSSFGCIRKFQLCGDPTQPTRYGFFEYASQAGARGCMTLDGKKMFNRPVRVSKAKDTIKGGRVLSEKHQEEFLRLAAIKGAQRAAGPDAAPPTAAGGAYGARQERRGMAAEDGSPRGGLPQRRPQAASREALFGALRADEEAAGGAQDGQRDGAAHGRIAAAGGGGRLWSRRHDDGSGPAQSTQGCSSAVSVSCESADTHSQLSPHRSPSAEVPKQPAPEQAAAAEEGTPAASGPEEAAEHPTEPRRAVDADGMATVDSHGRECVDDDAESPAP